MASSGQKQSLNLELTVLAVTCSGPEQDRAYHNQS